MTPLRNFDETGIAFPIPVLDADEVRAARSEYERLAAEHDGVLTRMNSLHVQFGWAYDLAAHPRVVDAVADLLGDDIVVWGTLLLCKPPHDDEFVAWHQDGAYAEYLGGTPAVSAWIALNDSTRANGCMRVVPGSHRTKLEHVETHREKNMLSRGQEIAADVDETCAVDVELRAGEMSLHHVDIIHGSSPNTSPHWRTGFIVRYATPAILSSPVPVLVARGRGAEHLPTLQVRP
jgi:non-haem Fe2+, alpha-ketoglutarate-dependent halogenase